MGDFSLLMLKPLLVADWNKIQQDKAVTHSVLQLQSV